MTPAVYLFTRIRMIFVQQKPYYDFCFKMPNVKVLKNPIQTFIFKCILIYLSTPDSYKNGILCTFKN